MKRLVLIAVAFVLLLSAAALSSRETGFLPFLQVEVEPRNPWTHLRINNDAEEFQFVLISDRTGGHRARIFSRAVDQINLLQPEFVLSVGDLIEGGSEKPEKVEPEWREFQTYVSRLQMPFFYVPGNHDISNRFQEKLWQEKFGRRYYHFVYKNVLFLALCSEDPPGSSSISPEQRAYIKKALEDNKGVRWTIVALHKPIWAAADLTKNGWLEVEKLLGDRPYTVFAGHVHRYQKFVRNGRNYYQLATTGGGSRLRGVPYGEFDHIVWVTMKKDGPVFANIMLDGVLQENLRPFSSDEEGVRVQQKATQPIKGVIYYDGTPATGAVVSFYLVDGDKKPQFTCDARIEGDGTFVPSTYRLGDGIPVGEYIVTVGRDRYHTEDASRDSNMVPPRYASVDSSPLRVTVPAGGTTFTLNLTREANTPARKPDAPAPGK